MKLASLKKTRDGKEARDGQLIVVSPDLQRYVCAESIAPTLQSALDDWCRCAPLLEHLSADLESDRCAAQVFDATLCASPLPRAFQWADGSAYVNHVELVRRARNAKMPESFWIDPLMYQGGSDTFLGPTDDIVMASEDWGIDMEGEVAVISGDVPAGVSAAAAQEQIRLVMLVNDVSLRGLIASELAKGFGFFQAKPSSAFSPVAVTPDELGEAWDGNRLHLPLLVSLNGELFGRADAGVDMTFDFPTLVSHAAKTRKLCAGSIIGSGTVSNRDPEGGPGKPVSEGGRGYSCVAEIRMIETIEGGKPETPFLHFGDRVQIEMKNAQGDSIFGCIDQCVSRPAN